ncbi:MAG: transcription repressor NadR [Erysipelotrichales bacterium]|nr:transcription repressor NadR [Erysipelotrichales bacterium]
MDAESRRKQILKIISEPEALITASMLAKTLNISRQIIVGDIALLRAQGYDIIATARGYMMPKYKESGQYIGKVACKHTPDNTTSELNLIVDLGATIVNIIVEHELYGEITGNLNLKSREDIEAFMKKVDKMKIKLLSELTFGIHLHTIACQDKNHFDKVCKALKENKFAL